jgi:hypothetical protein
MAFIAPLFYLTCERIRSNSKYALLCGILAAVWPNTARFDVVALPEALVALPVALVLFILSKRYLTNRKIWIYGLCSGLALGVGVLLRADVALLPIFLFVGVILLFGFQYAVKIFIPLVIAMGIVLLPQTIFNYQNSGGKLIPLGYSNGIAAFEGISQFGDTLGTVYSDDRLKIFEDQNDLYYPRGAERDAERTKKAFAIIKDHPVWYVKTLVKRVPLLLTPRGLFIIGDDTPTKDTKEDFTQKFPASFFNEWKNSPLSAFVKVTSSLLGILLMFFAVIGCWKYRRNYKIWILPFSVVAYYFLSHIPVNVEPRYFFPAVPFFIPLAGTFFMRKPS